MKPKRITDAWGLDDVSQWARDALEYSYQSEFRRQLKVVVRKLGRKHGALLGPVGLVGVTITSGLWELLDKFAPRGERCGVREQNVLEIATVGVLLDQHRTLAAAAQLAPSEPTPRRELDERVNGWRVGWHNAVTAAQSAVESGDATAAQQRIVELVRRALESRVGADKSDAARLIDAMFRPDAPVDPEAVSQREKLADVSTSLFLAQREKPARLANALFRKKDGRFTLSELGFRDVVVKRRRTKLTRVDVEDDLEELAVDKSATPVDAASQAEEARLAVEVRNRIDAFRAEAHARSSVSPVRRVVADNARALLKGEISARALAEKHELSRQAIDLEFSKLKGRILKGIGPRKL
ncbi:MAG: hypothetical protein HUU28_08030 [Planctomycetaceae bacterium]|nr:hypothetical protein [Planctomycetaceae bacterium]